MDTLYIMYLYRLMFNSEIIYLRGSSAILYSNFVRRSSAYRSIISCIAFRAYTSKATLYSGCT